MERRLGVLELLAVEPKRDAIFNKWVWRQHGLGPRGVPKVAAALRAHWNLFDVVIIITVTTRCGFSSE